ncbi:armadillo-type protein [Cladochytrium replicatum]|nr:armadillo-type protein [Cladochytrium replicatum]
MYREHTTLHRTNRAKIWSFFICGEVFEKFSQSIVADEMYFRIAAVPLDPAELPFLRAPALRPKWRLFGEANCDISNKHEEDHIPRTSNPEYIHLFDHPQSNPLRASTVESLRNYDQQKNVHVRSKVSEKIAAAESPEKRELVVYQWLMTVEKDIKKNRKETLRPYQSNIEKALIRFLGSGSPKPTKPIRQLIARCMVGIYSGSDTRTLFDTIVGIQNLINGKKDMDPAIRLAAIHCIGAITEAVGGKVLSLFGETTSALLKIIRSAKEAEIPLRFEALTALSRSLRGAGKGASETLIKDVVKQAKVSLTDKTCLIRSCGAELLEAIYKNTSHHPPVKSDEYESLVNLGPRALDATCTNNQKYPKRSAKANEAEATSQPQNILSITEMLNVLTTPLLKASTREVRVGIVETYASLFRESRTCCNFLLREVIGKSLTESGQISAIKDLATDWLRKWPAVLASDVAPSKVSLTCALNEAAALMHDLGSTAQLVQDSIVEPAMSLLSHTAPSVNTALAIYFKAVCLSLPSNLPRLMSRMISLIQKDLPNLASDKPDMLDRYVGYGNVLATLTSVIPQRSLYISFDGTAKVFGLANQLLKAASVNKDLHVAATQSQVAWTLISGLLTLGPSFVRVHSAQLMLLWKNVLQKPSSKDGHKGKSDWYHAISVRVTALGALECFLTHNAELLTSDVSKRIVVNLNNTMTFVNLLPTTYPQTSTGLGNDRIRLRLQDRNLLLRKRLFQCFKAISSPTLYEGSYSSVLRATIDVFAPDPDRGQLEKTPSGTAEKTGRTVDPAYTTSLLNGLHVEVAGDIEVEDRGIARALVKETDVQIVETLLTARHMGAIEYDGLLLLRKVSPGSKFGSYGEDARAQTPTVAAVEAAVELFSQVLPLQSNAMQELILDQLVKVHTYQGGKISVGRRNAAQLNILVALIGALKYIMAKKGTLGSGRTPQLIWEIAEDQLLGSDHGVRLAACEMVGRLSRVGGSASAVNPLIQSLVDQVVKNRDPDRRASSALALGYVHSYVGGMAAGSHLKTIVGLLHTLATDPYPLVHTWVLHSVWLTIESAGLMYGPFVNSTLSVVAKLLMSESHELAAPLANGPGSSSESGAYPIFGRILHALLGVVGPELQASSKMRDLFFNLYLVQRSPEEVLGAAVNNQLEEQLFSLLDTETDPVVRDEIRDVLVALEKHTAPVYPSRWLDLCKGILSRTASRTVAQQQTSGSSGQSPTKDGQNTDEDEEAVEVEGGEPVKPAAATVAGSAQQASIGPSTTTVPVSLTPRWRTQLFALTCVRQILTIIASTSRAEHFDLAAAKAVVNAAPSGASVDFLILHFPDLIHESKTSNEETHIQVMLRLSVLLAWAELCVASTRHPFLEEILKPNLATLARLWVSLLNDCAKMRLYFELDAMRLFAGVSSSASGSSGQLDSYISATREVLLPYYNQTWLVVMRALTSLIDVHDNLVTTIFRFDLNSETEEEYPEALGRSSKVFKVLGQGFIDKAVFLELIHVFDRVIQTEDVPIQTRVLRIVNQLIVDYKDDLVSSRYDIETSSPINAGYDDHTLTPETAVLLGLALESLISIILLPSVLELRTAALIPLAFFIFISILETEKFSTDVSPRVIICVKRLLDQLQSNPLLTVNKSVYAHVLQASVCSLLEGLSPESDEAAEVDAISEQDLSWTKNTLLSIVLITATCPALSHNPANQSSLIVALRRCIQSKHTQLSLVALQCVRTLLPITGRSEAAIANIGAIYAVQLLPAVVLRVIELSGKIKISSGRVASDQVLIAEEALRVLFLLYTTVTKEEKKPAMLAIIIPAFISVLSEKPIETLLPATRNLHTIATQTLLQLASAQPLVFKKSDSHISVAARTKLEQSFKSLISGNSESSQSSHHGTGADSFIAAQPKITLKSFS